MFSIIREFFLYCSGAHKEILRRPECAIDYPKFVAIGATVFSTAILAFVSATYAFYLFSQSIALSFLLSAGWSLIIFLLDRYLVSTLNRKVIPPTPSLIERLKLRSSEILSAAPRIVLAIMVSFFITVPLELKLFKNELDARIEEQRVAALPAVRTEARKQFPEIDRLEAENHALEEVIASKRKHTAELLDSLLDNPSQSIPELMRDQRTKEFLRSRAEFQEVKRVNEKIIAANSQELEHLNEQAYAQEKQIASSLVLKDSFSTRIRAMTELKAENKSVAWASILILLLFILLETAPVLVKLLSNVGPYEYFWGAFESMAMSHGQFTPTEMDAETLKIEESPATHETKQDHENKSRELYSTKLKPNGQLRAFLCHSTLDKPAVRSLCKKLKLDGIDAWLDEEQILPGQYWEAEIKMAMRSCDRIIVCFSRKAIDKAGYVQKEMREAVELAFEQPENSIFLIPAKLDECDIPASMSRFQFVNLFADDGYDRLMLSLRQRANENCSPPTALN